MWSATCAGFAGNSPSREGQGGRCCSGFGKQFTSKSSRRRTRTGRIAESYMDSLSVSEFMKEMRTRRKVVCIVSAAALAAFLLWGSIIGGIWLYHRTHESNFPVYYLDTVYLDGAEQGEK